MDYFSPSPLSSNLFVILRRTVLERAYFPPIPANFYQAFRMGFVLGFGKKRVVVSLSRKAFVKVEPGSAWHLVVHAT